MTINVKTTARGLTGLAAAFALTLMVTVPAGKSQAQRVEVSAKKLSTDIRKIAKARSEKLKILLNQLQNQSEDLKNVAKHFDEYIKHETQIQKQFAKNGPVQRSIKALILDAEKTINEARREGLDDVVKEMTEIRAFYTKVLSDIKQRYLEVDRNLRKIKRKKRAFILRRKAALHRSAMASLKEIETLQIDQNSRVTKIADELEKKSNSNRGEAK